MTEFMPDRILSVDVLIGVMCKGSSGLSGAVVLNRSELSGAVCSQ